MLCNFNTVALLHKVFSDIFVFVVIVSITSSDAADLCFSASKDVDYFRFFPLFRGIWPSIFFVDMGGIKCHQACKLKFVNKSSQ